LIKSGHCQWRETKATANAGRLAQELSGSIDGSRHGMLAVIAFEGLPLIFRVLRVRHFANNRHFAAADRAPDTIAGAELT
jgi:hypothetical protein